MRLRITSNAKRVAHRIDRVNQSFSMTARTAKEVARQAARTLIERTESGKNAGHAPFRPYSPRHIKERRSRGLPTNRVTLSLTGEMLGNIYAKSEQEHDTPAFGEVRSRSYVGVVYFRRPAMGQKAMWHHKGQGKMPKRAFFDFKRHTPSHKRLERHARWMIMAQVDRVASGGRA